MCSGTHSGVTGPRYFEIFFYKLLIKLKYFILIGYVLTVILRLDKTKVGEF